jgi:hypothetical protein
MDLGAFLVPGLYPAFLHDEQKKTVHWGYYFCRPNRRRGTWMAFKAPICPSILRLCLELPDFSLLRDGSLCSEKGASVTIFLVGEVSKFRCWACRNIFVLHFDNLVRFFT